MPYQIVSLKFYFKLIDYLRILLKIHRFRDLEKVKDPSLKLIFQKFG